MITYASASALRTQSSPGHCTPLKYQRLLRGWSQQDVADELYKLCAASGHPEVGVSIQQIYRWESGYCKPRPIYRKHLCQLYGLMADKLGFIEAQEVQA
jgi:transcriptional regulator with XRE-family HTH domain